MTDKKSEIGAAIKSLLRRAQIITLVEISRKAPKSFEKNKAALPKNPGKREDPDEALSTPKLPKDITDALKRSDHFAPEYQNWYSEALPVIQQLLPDRYDEFRALYRVERRKSIDVENYGIADYIAGIQVTRLGQPEFDTLAVMTQKFRQQQALLASALSRLNSILTDIQGILEASLFDTELDAARNLLKARHPRAAGVIAGVVLESHLKRLISNHAVPFRKVGTLTNLNDALKGANVYDVAQWRKIQVLADTRNLCGHSGDRDPTSDEVEELIQGVCKAIRTLF